MTDDSVDTGEVATVDVVLEGELASPTMRSYLAEVTFDEDLLEQPGIGDVMAGPGLPSVFFSANVSTAGKVKFGAVFLGPVSITSGQVLATINFRARDTQGDALLTATAEIVDGAGTSRTPGSGPEGSTTIGGPTESAGLDEAVPDASLAVPFFNNEDDFATFVSVFNNGDEPLRAMLRAYPTSRVDGSVGEPAVYDVVIGPGESDLVNTAEMASEAGLEPDTAGDVNGAVGGIVVDLFGVASEGDAILEDVSVGAFIMGSNGAMFKAPVCAIGRDGEKLAAPLFINRDALTTYVLVFNTNEDARAIGAVDLVSGGEVAASIAFDIPACGIEIIDTGAGTSAVGRALVVAGEPSGKVGGVIVDQDGSGGIVGMVSVFDDSGGAVAFDLAK